MHRYFDLRAIKVGQQRFQYHQPCSFLAYPSRAEADGARSMTNQHGYKPGQQHNKVVRSSDRGLQAANNSSAEHFPPVSSSFFLAAGFTPHPPAPRNPRWFPCTCETCQIGFREEHHDRRDVAHRYIDKWERGRASGRGSGVKGDIRNATTFENRLYWLRRTFIFRLLFSTRSPSANS